MLESEPVKDNPDKTEKVEKPEVTPPEKENVEELKAKIADQQRKLAGSKSEALNLKSEVEQLKTQMEDLKPKEESPEVNEDDIALFNAYAEKAGYVKKSDLESMQKNQHKQAQDEAVEKFLEAYPEYKPENDTDNSKWESLIQEYSLYKVPSTPNTKNWLTLLKKAHKSIAPDNSLKKGEALGMAKANLGEQAKLGGSGGGTPEKGTKFTPEQQAVREGFKKVRPDYFK